MSDHRHESYDVYGLDGTRQDAREALTLVAGLREDLGRAEERIHTLEEQFGTVGQLLETAVELIRGPEGSAAYRARAAAQTARWALRAVAEAEGTDTDGPL